MKKLEAAGRESGVLSKRFLEASLFGNVSSLVLSTAPWRGCSLADRGRDPVPANLMIPAAGRMPSLLEDPSSGPWRVASL